MLIQRWKYTTTSLYDRKLPSIIDRASWYEQQLVLYQTLKHHDILIHIVLRYSFMPNPIKDLKPISKLEAQFLLILYTRTFVSTSFCVTKIATATFHTAIDVTALL